MLQDAQYLRLLLAKGALVNVRNAVTGATPLAAAVLAGREGSCGCCWRPGRTPR